MIKDIDDGALISVRISWGIIGEFPITIGLDQWSILSPYLFALMIGEVTKSIQEVPWCMLFADDIFVDETRNGVNAKLEIWRCALEPKGSWLSMTKNFRF